MASEAKIRRPGPETAQAAAGALAGLPPLVTEAGACARRPAALNQSGRGAQPHWPCREKSSPRPPRGAVGVGWRVGGGARSQVQSILIGWDEAWVRVLSRGRLGAIPVHCCVVCVKVGREKQAWRVVQVLSCFTTVKGQLCVKHCERCWVGERDRSATNKIFSPKKFTI